MEKQGYGKDNEERRQYRSQGGNDASPYSTQAVAYEYGYVDRKDARCRLGDGKQVYKILFGYLPAFRYDFVLNQWNHGIAAANGECTDFKENGKCFGIYIRHIMCNAVIRFIVCPLQYFLLLLHIGSD